MDHFLKNKDFLEFKKDNLMKLGKISHKFNTDLSKTNNNHSKLLLVSYLSITMIKS